MNGLMLDTYHGDSLVTEDELRAIPTPERSRTHVPIPHANLLDMVRAEIHASSPYRCVNSSLGVDKTGQKFFGLMHVQNGDMEGQDHVKVIGLRNSHDKKLAAAVFCGGQVWVCSNLEIGAEHILTQKHTGKLMSILPSIIKDAVGRVSGMFDTISARYNRLKETPMTNTEVHDFLCEGLRNHGTVTGRSLPKVLKEWHNPTHPEFEDRTAWSLFNAHTETYKDGKNRMFNGFPNQTLQLHRQFEEFMSRQDTALVLDAIVVETTADNDLDGLIHANAEFARRY